MPRRYKRRRKQTSPFADLLFILAVILLLSSFGFANKLIEATAYAIPILLGVAILLIAIIVLVALRRRKRQRKIYEAYTLANIDTMSGLEFEQYLAELLRKSGYQKVRITEQYDLGVDIVAEKDSLIWGIQAKRYSEKHLVKAEAVRAVFTALTRYKCDRAIVITNSYFSRPARELANDNSIKLVDRDLLQTWIYENSKRAFKSVSSDIHQ